MSFFLAEDSPSLNKKSFNELILKLKGKVKLNQIATIHKLDRHFKLLKKRYTTSEQAKVKNEEKANKLAEQKQFLKSLHIGDLTTLVAVYTKSLVDVGKDSDASIEDRAMCHVSNHKEILPVLLHFRSKYPNWLKEVPDIIKGLGLLYRKKRIDRYKKVGKLDAFLERETRLFRLLHDIVGLDIDANLLKKSNSRSLKKPKVKKKDSVKPKLAKVKKNEKLNVKNKLESDEIDDDECSDDSGKGEESLSDESDVPTDDIDSSSEDDEKLSDCGFSVDDSLFKSVESSESDSDEEDDQVVEHSLKLDNKQKLKNKSLDKSNKNKKDVLSKKKKTLGEKRKLLNLFDNSTVDVDDDEKLKSSEESPSKKKKKKMMDKDFSSQNKGTTSVKQVNLLSLLKTGENIEFEDRKQDIVESDDDEFLSLKSSVIKTTPLAETKGKKEFKKKKLHQNKHRNPEPEANEGSDDDVGEYDYSSKYFKRNIRKGGNDPSDRGSRRGDRGGMRARGGRGNFRGGRDDKSFDRGSNDRNFNSGERGSGRGRGGARSRGSFRGRGEHNTYNKDFTSQRESRGRGSSAGRWAKKDDTNCMPMGPRQITKPSSAGIHPSWAAKKAIDISIGAFQGKKTTFDD